MVHEPIAHGGLMYIAALRVGNYEMAVTAMPVRAAPQVGMERKNSIHKTQRKILHVGLGFFTACKFPPSKQ